MCQPQVAARKTVRKEPRTRRFEALAGAGINIRMISTSEIKISVLINEEDSEKAVKAIHDQFFGD